MSKDIKLDKEYEGGIDVDGVAWPCTVALEETSVGFTVVLRISTGEGRDEAEDLMRQIGKDL